MTRKTSSLVIGLLTIFPAMAGADQGSFTNSGGSTGVGSSVDISTSANPAGPLTMDCPIMDPTICSGGSLTYLSTDGSTSVTGMFTAGKVVETCSGGGRGGHVKCAYTFDGTFDGTLTSAGVAQSITGTTYQVFGTSGGAATGVTAYNSAYEPFYYSDGQQIHRSDDLKGTHLLSFGTTGSGKNQFYGPSGLALDASGRIYVADVYNCRIVRIDNIQGANWTTYGGTCGSGQDQLDNPAGVFVDSAGKIYIADTGNTRIVRIDDMTGKNRVAYGAAGNGAGQFAGPLTSLAVDGSGHIYIPDGGNKRLVRIDDMTGANWTVLTQSPNLGGYIHLFGSPGGVALDPSGKIYVVDGTDVIRVDDMTGAGWSGFNLGGGLYSIGIDKSGTAFVGGGDVNLIDNFAGSISSSAFGYYIYGIAPALVRTPRPPAVTVSPTSLAFGNQNVGAATAPQPVTISNFGGSPLVISNILKSSGFIDTTDCPADLVASTSCTVQVAFQPVKTGSVNGRLIFADNSANMGPDQYVVITGTGTAPVTSLEPLNLTFPSQLLHTASAAQTVVVLNTGTGPLQVSSVSIPAPFTENNNCAASLVPGTGCTVRVSFTPAVTGDSTSILTIVDNTGTHTVPVSGTGTSSAPAVTVSPASLVFPLQQTGTKSPGQVVTVTNHGATAVGNAGVAISGDFAETTTCGASTAAGKTCTITVTFTPAVPGVRSGTLTVKLSSGAQTVVLAGSGDATPFAGALAFSPSSIDFANYTIGDNPSQTLTISNPTQSTVGIRHLSFAGSSALTQQNNCPALMSAGSSCTVTFTFVPTTYGSFTSNLTVSESSGAVDIIPVTGTSVPDSGGGN